MRHPTRSLMPLLLAAGLSGTAQAEDLLKTQDWRHFTGASVAPDGTVSVQPMNRWIRPKVQGKWYAHPPINLQGPRLDFAGDFRVDATLDVTQAPQRSACLDLYGTVPIPYDEWRVDGRNLRLQVRQGELRVFMNMQEQTTIRAAGLGPIVHLSVQRQAGTLSIQAEGQNLGPCPDQVFQTGRMYFGADAEPGGGFRITGLEASGPEVKVTANGPEHLKAYPVPADSLRVRAQALDRPFWIGTAIHAHPLLSDPEYGATVAREFNMVTAELDMKFQAIEPREGVFAWQEADQLVDFAEKNHLRFRGHCLVWHEALPEWVWEIYRSGDRPRLRAVLMNHVAAVVSRYKGRVQEWDVLNEIFSDDATPTAENPYGLRDAGDGENNPSPWYRAFGPSIYVDVLKEVKRLDPDCELWINEYGIEQAKMRDKLENLERFVSYARSQGATIDGVGFQCHNYDPDKDPSTAQDTLASMQFISRMGVKVHISELDVDQASRRPGLFADKLQVCLDSARNPACRSLSLWGFTDKYGSMSGPENEGGTGDNLASPNWGAVFNDSLPFTETYAKRSAYPALLKALAPPVAAPRYEAEAGTCGGGAVKEQDASASGGQSIQSLDAVGAYSRCMNLDGGSGGSRTLVIAYASQDNHQQLSLYLNGKKTKRVSFQSTGGYDRYTGRASVKVTLKPGALNSVMLKNDAGDRGDVNLDFYEIQE